MAVACGTRKRLAHHLERSEVSQPSLKEQVAQLHSVLTHYSSVSVSCVLQTWIILEYCDKGCLSVAMAFKPFRSDLDAPPNMNVVLMSCIDIARGMQYLHEEGIVHSDLKSGNVLLQSVGALLLSVRLVF